MTQPDPAQAFRMRDLIGEKLNLLEGRRGEKLTHPYAGLHYKIGLHVPEPIIMKALAVTNDAFLKAKDAHRPFKPSSYFHSTIKGLLKEEGIPDRAFPPEEKEHVTAEDIISELRAISRKIYEITLKIERLP